MSSWNDYPWDDPEQVLIRQQPATAVYTNPYDMVVVRQQSDPHKDDDPFVIIAPANVLTVVRAMLAEVGLDYMLASSRPALPAPTIAAGTGAERQRRYRQRNAERNGVTAGDAGSVTNAPATTLFGEVLTASR